MHKIVFTGPTLSWHDLKGLNLKSPIIKIEGLESISKYGTDYKNTMFIHPPIAGGDLYKLKDYKNDFLIGIIDGYFENQISVWHREILFLLSKGIKVFGASSMGALRAAELAKYGMIGVGKIYQNYAHNIWEDDDEVTVSHGPAEIGYPQICEAMVNIRFTIEEAIHSKVLQSDIAAKFLSIAKETFYKKRNYGRIIRECIEHHGMRETDFSKFLLWLQKYRIDQKKLDAIALIHLIDNNRDLSYTEFDFEDTLMWRNSIKA